ncbi:hypothetical protein GGR58DRAFT_488738 [Xylaria digitata]|nr:hypothetical protein GGR58DRAFT_488738 [Xylaria digitata]
MHKQHHEHLVGKELSFLPTRLIEIDRDREGYLLHLVLTSAYIRENTAKCVVMSYHRGKPADIAIKFKTEKSTLNNCVAGLSL